MNTLAVVKFLVSLWFASAFLLGRYLRAPQHHLMKRSLVSLGAGVSVAYVFLHVLPVLENMRRAFEAIPDIEHPFHGLLVYVAAMLGFLFFYGIDRGMNRSTSGRESYCFSILHLGGFGIYVWLVSYFLVRGSERELWEVSLYSVAMFLHFITISYSLRNQHGATYDKRPSVFLALCTMAGWFCAIYFSIPMLWLIVLVSLVAGAILVNTMMAELSHDDGGLFIPFIGGALLFSFLLLIVH